MAVKFIIDSAADILPEECARMGIVHLPLKVIFGNTEYADAVDMTHQAFYEKLVESDVLPTTCQIPPADFADAYEKVTAAGDTAVVVTVSGKLSGTYQSAMIAAEDYEGGDGYVQIIPEEYQSSNGAEIDTADSYIWGSFI